MDNKKGSFKLVFIVLIISLVIASLWNKVSWISKPIHSVLDPSLGALLNWNLLIGMIIIVAILNLITTLIQKYTTDQETLRSIKQEQKALQEEMKSHRDNPQKMMELQKKSLEFIPQTMKLSMRSFTYTAVPLILLFRWFIDTFNALGNPKFLGFLGWIWFYLLSSIIISSILRKILKVV
ncbi:DUF106 domain-containing protein [Candidatus Pacearchaeota archaeon]|nr:DUF106 domain-containing protein [Candidatus Pacearchaeota archaeon]